jgi:methionyl-tRNA formyltransferase
MRVVAFVNGELGSRLLPIVAGRSELAAVVVHPRECARARDVFERIAADAAAVVVEAAELATAECQERLRASEPEWGFSAGFGYILRRAVFGIPARGTLNVHTSLLPWNRGAHPNVWTIVDETPAGVSMHWIDDGVDTGDLLAQREVPYGWTDTGRTLQTRLLDAAETLVRDTWPPSTSQLTTRRPQPPGGSVHRVADLASLDFLDVDAQMPVRRVLSILRARTYPPHRSAGIHAPEGDIELPLAPRRFPAGRPSTS